MKKLTTLVLVAIMALCVSLTACESATDVKYVTNDATDTLQEDFGIALKKGDTEMMNAVNAVIDEWLADGTLDKYNDYYSALAEDESASAPEGLKTEWNFTESGPTVTMYTESGFAPYEFMNGTEIVGIDVAIMSQVAENLGGKLDIKDVLFDTIVTCVENDDGKAAGAAGLTINEERKQNVDFSHVYASSTLSIVSAEDKAYSTLASLAGLKIGVQEGTSGDLIASQAISATGYEYEDEEGEIRNVKINAEIVQYKTYSAALAALKTGKIDVIFMDKLPSQLLIKNV